jgi:8-oxo-dGTP pyrophosphatase MutT (NUDIX family)
MRRKRRVQELESFGGVVYRIRDGGIDVALCGRKYPPIWGLPKGTPEPDETQVETALREVREETGLEVEEHRFIDTIEYWFVRAQDGVRCHKMVHFYLMTAMGGDMSLHDHEFDVVKWSPINEALESLTYENEVNIVQKGISLVEEKSRG